MIFTDEFVLFFEKFKQVQYLKPYRMHTNR